LIMSFWTSPRRKPLVIAHRGGALLAAENSAAAFQAAAAVGADAVETDVRQTADGHLVCFHDDTLERLCGDPRAVAEIDLATLRQKIPSILTLREALSASRPLGVLLDVKLLDGVALEGILRDLAGADIEPRIVLGLRSLDLIRVARRLDSRIPILSLIHTADAIEKARDAGADWFRLWQADLTEARVSRVRESEMHLAVMVGQPRNMPLDEYPRYPVGKVDAEGLLHIASFWPDAVMLDDPRLMA